MRLLLVWAGRLVQSELRPLSSSAARRVLSLFFPGAFCLAIDVTRRPRAILGFDALHALGFVGSLALTTAAWALLLFAARHTMAAVAWAARVSFVVLFGLSVGVQSAFWARYHVYCGEDAELQARGAPSALTCELPLDWQLVAGVGLAGLAAVGLLVASAKLAPRTGSRFVHYSPIPALGLVFALGLTPTSYRTWQSATPEEIFFEGWTASVRERFSALHRVGVTRTGRRHPQSVPAIDSRLPRPPNVLFILDESVRYSSFQRAALRARAALPASGRVDFDELRAVDSSTVISMAALLTGSAPNASRAHLDTAPSLWGFAKAAGYETAYWTSQYVLLFGMRFMSQDEPIDRFLAASHLEDRPDGDAGARDATLLDRVAAELTTLHEPYFAVVQLSNAHYPYLVDESDMPFTADAATEDERPIAERRARYENAIHATDKALAGFFERFREQPSAARTVILYTSDHGESLGENGTIGHTISLFESEVHVPGYWFADEGTLPSEARRNLEEHRALATYHLDIAPTLLDVMGLWGAPALEPFTQEMLGHPLTRPPANRAPIPLSNCSWVWQCQDANYGAIQYPMKLFLRRTDAQAGYRCFDLSSDPTEDTDLPESACGELGPFVRRLFPITPSQVPRDTDPPF
ncbi:MAG: sulfatase-like hydrolase/transferase [Polyangiaceae bacterium]